MQKKMRVIHFLFLIFFTLLFLAACGTGSPEEDIEVLVRPAKLIDISPTGRDDFFSSPAVINAQQISTLSFEVSGLLEELLVVSAQSVKQGEVLAKLDKRDLKNELRSAQAQFDVANTEYRRAVRLLKEDAISRSELEKRKSTWDVKRAQLEIAQKALQDAVLVAPYDGNIVWVEIDEQQSVQAGEGIIRIIGKEGLEATVDMPAGIIVRADRNKSRKFGAYILLDAAPDIRIPAIFKEATLEADAASQTYEVVFTFEAPEDLVILPGMNAVVWFNFADQLPEGNSSVAIPHTAIVTDGDQKYVWIVDSSTMIVSRRDIEIEEGVGSSVRIISGLEFGDTIVGAGVFTLSEGMEIYRWSI